MTQAAHPPLPERDTVNAYQYDFSDVVWTPDAAVTLCHVPWDSSYRDVARFVTDDAKETYFNGLRNAGQSIRLERLTILKYGEPIILQVPFNTANAYNYLIVDGDTYPRAGQSATAQNVYYYFIQDVEYISPNATRLWVQLDVWQTYYERIQFNRCYVERGHIAIANNNSTLDNLSDYLCIPEGLDFGNEYIITDQAYWNFLEQQPMVVVVSTTYLAGDFGTIENPNLQTASGGVYDNIPNGCNVYAFTATNFKTLMSTLSQYPWVAQGIIMLTMVPRNMLTLGTEIDVQGIPCYDLEGVSTADADTYLLDNLFGRFNYPTRYKDLLKFYTTPYSFIEMTAMSGGEIVLKPECFDWFEYGENYGVNFRLFSVVSPPHIRAMIYPEIYNSKGGEQVVFNYKTTEGTSDSASIPDGEGLDMALQIGNFPQFTLVNNQYLNYLASTAHTRNYQFETAEWSFTKAKAGVELAFNQASKGIGLRQDSTSLEIAAMRQRMGVQQNMALVQGAGGVLGNAINRNWGNAVSSAVSAGADAYAAGANTAINSQLAQAQTNVSNTGARYNRDTNAEYGSFAATGDYQNAVHQIQAKVQDAKLTQPSTIGQNGGEAFNFSNGMVGVVFKFKRIKDQFVRTIGEYWFRYGYYVNEYVVPPPTLACCSKFTYWKMHEIYISAAPVPEMYKAAIRGIFQKGVTVWTNPDEIGVIDPATNTPLEGVEY